ncbi:DUF5368 domain-containing protein [Celeribacter indicus]|uniref:Transmembrane protein n=1 Tax=Celeribacter indicus TaxID=1208324 RepID=A0A0B5DYF8_9RHOB|nr:DUF5368 domain-containing protein [Celeribacter indicus]AJE46190.1 hypothetical protein P73_1475 [Celeribacter indicus]SDW49507.1 hypothetical protein SAMN05443573_10420 [Celeribacter indicus]
MKDLTLETIIAVLEEIFGRGLFWTMAGLAAAVTLAYLYVLIRDRAVSWHKFLWAQLSMPLGAVLAVWFVLAITHSHVSDIGGAVDLIVFLGIATLGAVGMAILVYTVQSLIRPLRRAGGS